MRITSIIAGVALCVLTASPALAGNDKRAAGQADKLFAAQSQGGTNNSAKDGAAKTKFPPGLVDKCNDPDRPGAQGIARACENQTRSRGG